MPGGIFGSGQKIEFIAGTHHRKAFGQKVKIVVSQFLVSITSVQI
jgi:hypothetical protein